jgi:cell division protein FtsI/penicillin-binding protein 2
VLCIRLFTLQVVDYDQYAQFARDNQLQRERVPGPRGFLRDRNGAIMVDNALHFEVLMSWRTRNDVVETLRDVSDHCFVMEMEMDRLCSIVPGLSNSTMEVTARDLLLI